MTRSTLAMAGGKAQQFTALASDAAFTFRRPEPPLSEFVDTFWLYEGRGAGPGIDRILPTGTLELAINLREGGLGFSDAARPEVRSRFSGAVVSGAHGRAFAPDAAGAAFIAGVHFKPGGAFPFLGLPAGELADAHVDLEALWGPAAGRLRERLCGAGTPAERFRLLREALSSRPRHGAGRHHAVPAALEMFGGGRAGPTVREAARRLGLSQRRLIQVFKAEVGLTPKLFSRIRRFQRTRAFVRRNPSPDWAALASDFGYFDQSHFIREFLEFSGLSPAAYVNRHERLIGHDRHIERDHPPHF